MQPVAIKSERKQVVVACSMLWTLKRTLYKMKRVSKEAPAVSNVYQHVHLFC